MTKSNQAALGRFGENEIRAELRGLVERERSSILERLAAAEMHFESEIETSPKVGGNDVQKMRTKFKAAASDAGRTFEMMLDFIDRR